MVVWFVALPPLAEGRPSGSAAFCHNTPASIAPNSNAFYDGLRQPFVSDSLVFPEQFDHQSRSAICAVTRLKLLPQAVELRRLSSLEAPLVRRLGIGKGAWLALQHFQIMFKRIKFMPFQTRPLVDGNRFACRPD